MSYPQGPEATARVSIATFLVTTAIPSLVMVEGPDAGACFTLHAEQVSFVLGRGDFADVQIDDDTVSRSHATVTLDAMLGRGRTARVLDLNSRNGTFVNGVRVESANLIPGDKLQIGRIVLRYDLVDPADRNYVAHRRLLAAAPAETSGLTDDTATFGRALSKLWLAFQPIVSSVERRIVGWEALVRSDERAFARPERLLLAAERLGRVHDVGRAVRALAATFVDGLPTGTYLSVNLHPLDLEDPNLIDPAAPLSRVAHRVVLELTERASVERLDDLELRVRVLRALGYRIAIDDVGAGYAGLGTVTRIVPDVLKVDRSIVHDVHRSITKAKVIQSLARLCAELGVAMVLEGVETEADRESARRMGCDVMQGYLFARPHDRTPSREAKV